MRSEEGDDPMTVEEMKKKKTELGFSCEQISDRSGVPLGTVQKIFSGITKRPRYDTICQLEKAVPMEYIIFTDNLGRCCSRTSLYAVTEIKSFEVMSMELRIWQSRYCHHLQEKKIWD